MKGFLASLKELWSRLCWLDLLSFALAAAGAVLASVPVIGGVCRFL